MHSPWTQDKSVVKAYGGASAGWRGQREGKWGTSLIFSTTTKYIQGIPKMYIHFEQLYIPMG